MTQTRESQGPLTRTFFARQPILDGKKRVWGYGLYYRDRLDAARADFPDGHGATLHVAASSTYCSLLRAGSGFKVLINYSDRSIEEKVPLALPCENTVLDVPEDILANPAAMQALAELKAEGYSVAVDGFSARPEAKPLHQLADFARIDVLGKTEAELAPLVAAAKDQALMLIAKRVEDHPTFDLAKRLGFDLFQGFFFQKPETIACRKLSSIQVSRLKILKLIEGPEPDLMEIGEVIQADVSLSYRLLGFLNSAFFGFVQKVDSIMQALVLLGWKQLRNWLRLIILTDLTPPEKTSEIPLHSVQRARFLEGVAGRHRRTGADPGRLFLLGLFSLLDALLEAPMRDIVDELPLTPELKAALCGEPNAQADWLALAASFERADWGRVEELIARLGLDPVELACAYAEALEWAESLFRHIT